MSHISRGRTVAHHVNQLKSSKNQRIRDDQLRHLALFKDYVIVTKDDDFVSSYVSCKVPEQMIFVFNLDYKNALIESFQKHINSLHSLVEKHGFLEINPNEIRWPFGA